MKKRQPNVMNCGNNPQYSLPLPLRMDRELHWIRYKAFCRHKTNFPSSAANSVWYRNCRAPSSNNSSMFHLQVLCCGARDAAGGGGGGGGSTTYGGAAIITWLGVDGGGGGGSPLPTETGPPSWGFVPHRIYKSHPNGGQNQFHFNLQVGLEE